MRKSIGFLLIVVFLFSSISIYPIHGFEIKKTNFQEQYNFDLSLNLQGDWQRIVIDSNLDGAHNIIVENVDNDNKPDLVADAYRAEVVVWYKQPEDPINDPWTKYVIDHDLPNAHDIQIGDIDGDGLIDVVGLSLSESWTNYNLGNGSVTWYKKPIDPTGSWTKTIIAESNNTGLLGARSAGLGDIDSDGDLDIAVAVDTHKYSSQGRLFWYENPGGSDALNSSLWNEFLIDDIVGTGADAQIGDIDKDGNPDIVYSGNYGSPTGTFIYFAPPDPTDIYGWNRVSVAGNSYHVHLIDFDSDDDLDILRASAFDDLISFIENPYPADPRISGNWIEFIIEQDPSIHIANRVSTADIDGDGDLDIGMNADPTPYTGIFKWYRRPADPTDIDSYEDYVIDSNPTYTAYAHDSYLEDIDNDGDIDMVGVGPNALVGTVLWWINEIIPDLDCNGNLRWENVRPEETLSGSFTVENVGGSDSLLDWEISDYPDWGEWNFYPENGDDLAYGNQAIVNVKVVSPLQKNQEYSGIIKISNKENSSDSCEIDVYLKTPRSLKFDNILLRLFRFFKNAF
ncbi:MAG: VCBS repeat-containing protein [Thermoplasmatales archaeon]|nr:MAG: VCBS repeat-containing protein [Thermoplasmatales archaeon]